ncbi:coiled-coil domain-containing protein 114-like [Polypterus senegalus]|uniref:coiled-coil domain-containing protein 114-like n=1 Tax=Polypterus senegalus TaxID=55291 RepID=UPI0019627418|nr:coiled-coil domain-containing protein 114-like [Polypterus senegalus]
MYIKKHRRSRLDSKYIVEGTSEDDRRRLWDIASRRKSTLQGFYFKDAIGEYDPERKVRRPTEHRRKSTMLGTSYEEQERLKEIMKRTLENQAKTDEKPTLDFDPDLFYNVYMEREDQNFALFNFVTEQMNEIENVQEHIEELKLSIAILKNKDFNENEEHKIIMAEVEQKLKQATEAKNKYKADIKKKEKTVDCIRTGVEDLMKKLGIEHSVSSVSLGWKHGTQNQNISVLLGIIEQRASELLTSTFFLKYQDSVRSDQSTLPKYLHINEPPVLQDYDVHLPSTSEEEEDSKEDIRPLSKTELQLKALKSIQTKEGRSTDKLGKPFNEKLSKPKAN